MQFQIPDIILADMAGNIHHQETMRRKSRPCKLNQVSGIHVHRDLMVAIGKKKYILTIDMNVLLDANLQ